MEETTYTVRQIGIHGHSIHYEIAKWQRGDEPAEVYDVTVTQLKDRVKLWCNCLGFRRQRYPKEEHKHILLVNRWLHDGKPAGQHYKLIGASRNPNIEPVEVF